MLTPNDDNLDKNWAWMRACFTSHHLRHQSMSVSSTERSSSSCPPPLLPPPVCHILPHSSLAKQTRSDIHVLYVWPGQSEVSHCLPNTDCSQEWVLFWLSYFEFSIQRICMTLFLRCMTHDWWRCTEESKCSYKVNFFVAAVVAEKYNKSITTNKTIH